MKNFALGKSAVVWRGNCLLSDAPSFSGTNLAADPGDSAPRRPDGEICPIYESTIGGEQHMSTGTKKKSSSKIRLQPIGDRVVVEREASEGRTAGGIVLPDTAKDKPARGTIVSVGDGKLLEDGTRSKLQVKVGDRVIFSSYAGEAFKIDDQELLLMREDDILAILEG
jgi:chaperonin GroES